MLVYLISLTALSPPKLFSNKNVKETKKKKKRKRHRSGGIFYYKTNLKRSLII